MFYVLRFQKCSLPYTLPRVLEPSGYLLKAVLGTIDHQAHQGKILFCDILFLNNGGVGRKIPSRIYKSYIIVITQIQASRNGKVLIKNK